MTASSCTNSLTVTRYERKRIYPCVHCGQLTKLSCEVCQEMCCEDCGQWCMNDEA